MRLGGRPGCPLTPRFSHPGFLFLGINLGSKMRSPVTVTSVTGEPGLLLLVGAGIT